MSFLELIKLTSILEAADYDIPKIDGYIQGYWNSRSLKDIKDIRLRLIHGLEHFGGGLSPLNRVNRANDAPSALQAAKELWPTETFVTENISRNSGIIEITPEGIEYNDAWADDIACIDLDTQTISIDSCLPARWPSESIEKIPYIETPFNHIPFAKLKSVYKEWDEKTHNGQEVFFNGPHHDLLESII